MGTGSNSQATKYSRISTPMYLYLGASSNESELHAAQQITARAGTSTLTTGPTEQESRIPMRPKVVALLLASAKLAGCASPEQVTPTSAAAAAAQDQGAGAALMTGR